MHYNHSYMQKQTNGDMHMPLFCMFSKFLVALTLIDPFTECYIYNPRRNRTTFNGPDVQIMGLMSR